MGLRFFADHCVSNEIIHLGSVVMGLRPAKLDENHGWRRRAAVWHVCAPFERAHTRRTMCASPANR